MRAVPSTAVCANFGRYGHSNGSCAYSVVCSAQSYLFMVEHSIPALEVVLVFITIYLHIFLLKTARCCARVFLTSDTH